MRCVVHLMGKTDAVIECDLNEHELRNNCDTSELYDLVGGYMLRQRRVL